MSDIIQFPIVSRFQRHKWSDSRRKIHDLEAGGEIVLPASDRNNITTSIERIEEAYEQTRRYSMHKIPSGFRIYRHS